MVMEMESLNFSRRAQWTESLPPTRAPFSSDTSRCSGARATVRSRGSASVRPKRKSWTTSISLRAPNKRATTSIQVTTDVGEQSKMTRMRLPLCPGQRQCCRIRQRSTSRQSWRRPMRQITPPECSTDVNRPMAARRLRRIHPPGLGYTVSVPLARKVKRSSRRLRA
jgi:hypothetical protein